MSKNKEALINVINLARTFGVLDDTAARNKLIKIEFDELCMAEPNTSVESLMNVLSEKHFLSHGQMRKICYPNEEPIVIGATQKKIFKRKYARRR